MTKVYLILQFDCDKKGMMLVNTKKIYEVFTNRRLANNAKNYLNKKWTEAFDTKDFTDVKWYAVQMHTISKEDYNKLSF